jgi:hypothetical protein
VATAISAHPRSKCLRASLARLQLERTVASLYPLSLHHACERIDPCARARSKEGTSERASFCLCECIIGRGGDQKAISASHLGSSSRVGSAAAVVATAAPQIELQGGP